MSEWQAIALEGPEAIARAFVSGFLAGRGIDPGVAVFADDLDPGDASVLERLRDLFGRGTHQVVLLPRRDGEALLAAVAAGASPGLSASERQLVGEASFTFRAETPSPEAAARIREVLCGEPPDGVTRIEIREEGHVDPEGRGVELRATLHEFTYRAEGIFRGRLPEIALMRRRVAALDFVDAGPLVLSTPG
jgi:hypothetical protein